ncbi:ecdysteroid kinase domain-containing protein [Phthorimaea operculella]|nr:ecdysteroid kinase domain-containing protein [Phthorimaea operculella]
MAHMHALSIALEQRRPEEFKQITKNIPELYFSEDNRSWYAKYLKNAIDIDLKTLAEFEDVETSIYYKKFSELVSGDPYGLAIRLLSDRSRRTVIAHGDAWFPNFLRSKTRTVAIDFQLVRHASPVTDVAYFVLISKQCANKENALEAFRVYHEALTYYLNDVGIDANQVYSWEDFNTDLKLFGKFGLIAASTSIPLLCSERCDVLEQFDVKYSGVDKIPLEELWPLTELKTEEDKMYLVNAVRLAVDIGLI